jgi:uridine nucleosidase
MRKIIIDTDPGVDDVMAIYLALRSPEIEVVGLTTIFGNSNVEATTRNALNLLHIAGRADIPVAKGAPYPLVIAPLPTGEFVHGDDAMGNIGWNALLNPIAKTDSRYAAQFIIDAVMSQPGEITLAPIGPLTNIALALRLEPRIAQHVKEVVMMGGSILHPGNVSPLAEANIHNDPHAAHIVFSANWNMTMAGLDVTEAVQMDDAYFAAMRKSGDPLGVFIADVVPFYQHFHRDWYAMENGEIHTHDPSAIAYLIDPTLFRGEQHSINVPLDGPAIGSTVADRRGKFFNTPKVNCLVGVDGARLKHLFFERLTQHT